MPPQLSIVASEVLQWLTGLRRSEAVRILLVPATQTAGHRPLVSCWLVRCCSMQLRMVMELVSHWLVRRSEERMLAALPPGLFLPAPAAVGFVEAAATVAGRSLDYH